MFARIDSSVLRTPPLKRRQVVYIGSSLEELAAVRLTEE